MTLKQRIKRIKQLKNIQNRAQKEIKKLLGPYKIICGYCYQDYEKPETWEDHLKKPGAFYKGCMSGLGIYTDFWEKDKKGKWIRTDENIKNSVHYGGKQ